MLRSPRAARTSRTSHRAPGNRRPRALRLARSGNDRPRSGGRRDHRSRRRSASTPRASSTAISRSSTRAAARVPRSRCSPASIAARLESAPALRLDRRRDRAASSASTRSSGRTRRSIRRSSQRKGVQIYGPTYDTFELASMLLPACTQHSLGAIADHLGIEFMNRHRAMADAEAARARLRALRERLAASPPDVLAEADALSRARATGRCATCSTEIAAEHPRTAGRRTSEESCTAS